MASKDTLERVEIVRMANGYMLRQPPDFNVNRGEQTFPRDCYVFNTWADAAAKALELIGNVDK